MSTTSSVRSNPLQSCAMRIGEIELQRTTSENCKVSWTIYVDNETIHGWRKEDHSPGVVFKRDVDRRLVIKPGTKINVVFHKHRKGPLPKPDEIVALDGQDILRKLQQASISPGTAAAQVVHEVSAGRLTAKMSFTTTSNAHLREEAVQALMTASSVIGRPSLQDSMDTVRRTLNLLGTVGVTISEINPRVKAAVAAFNIVVDKAHKVDKDAADLRELMEDMENMLSFVHGNNFEASVRFAKLTISEMLVSIESTFHFAADYFSSNAALRAVQSEVTSLDHSKIKNFRKEFLKFKEQLNRDLKLQIVSDMHQQELRACLAELLPMLPMGYVNGYNASQGCMEGTRAGILQEICAWSSSPQSAGLFWLSGVAGSGKTSIASSLVGQLRAQGRICVSFFCQYQDINLASSQAVIPSLAQQIMITFPPFQQPLFEVLSKNRAVIGPSIWTISIEDQFKYLMKEPLSAMSEHHHIQPLIIIVDALDECDEKNRVQLVVFLKMVSALLPWLKVFLTSRPQVDIRNHLSPVLPFDLQEHVEGTTEDILHFTEARLSDITPLRHMEPGWIGEADIKKFVILAGDLFIWAKAALDYIGRATSPKRALKNVLALQASGSSHEKQMDELYNRVLQVHFNDDNNSADFRQVMGIVLISAVPMSITVLNNLLVGGIIEKSTLITVISDLGALLYTDLIRPFHASFSQYLTSSRCPEEFRIYPQQSAPILLSACLRVMNSSNGLHFNMYSLQSSYNPNFEIPSAAPDPVSEELKYSCRYWVDHLNQLTDDFGLEMEAMRLLCDFLSKKLLFWMEVVTVLRMLSSIIQSLELTRSIKQVEISHQCHDLWRFLKQFSIPISFSISHIYISALPFAPGETLFYNVFKQHFRGMTIIQGLEKRWSSSCINVLEGLSRLVSSVAFSPDGARIVSGSYDCTIRIWDAQTGEAVGAPLEGHSGSVSSVAFSPDGARIVSGSDDRTIRIWDVPRVILRKQQYEVSADGWVLDRKGNKLLWMPIEYRKRFNDCSLFSMPRSGPNSTLNVDMSEFAHGTKWTKCYAGTLV